MQLEVTNLIHFNQNFIFACNRLQDFVGFYLRCNKTDALHIIILNSFHDLEIINLNTGITISESWSSHALQELKLTLKNNFIILGKDLQQITNLKEPKQILSCKGFWYNSKVTPPLSKLIYVSAHYDKYMILGMESGMLYTDKEFTNHDECIQFLEKRNYIRLEKDSEITLKILQ